MSSDIGISVILCCYNSARKLPETLRHLSRQVISDDIPVEVILVDNGSSDNTQEVGRAQWAELREPYAMHITHEGQLGQVFARIKGVQEAIYDLIIFCDDDNWLDKGYLARSYELMMSDESIGGLGGRGVASNTAGHLLDLKEPSIYACGVQHFRSGDISKRGYLWGAGLVSRKSILERVFDLDFPMVSSGRTEEKLFSGDDVEICMRILLLGYKLYFDEKLLYQHFIPEERLTDEYRGRLRAGVAGIANMKRDYAWEVIKSKTASGFLWMVMMKHLVLYVLLKLRLIERQRYAIVNPFKVKGSKRIIDFAEYARSI